MTHNIAISLQNVSKIFKRYRQPADRLKEILLSEKKYAKEFWALRDISLEIPRGETWGIVGRNGAGKSTLLKIITGTLQPTSGKVQVYGRVSALLELGSGFNPEFTGRQNVFFNGRLLGLSQDQVRERFDNIVSFADIGDFLEQPVKTYSSGMRARLAFAVASSVDPDVLIVDEVLAVGDAAFQRKCFSRMERIRERGCTILFVSHSVGSVVELCDHGLLIDSGECLLIADAKTVTTQYQRLIYAPSKDVPRIKEELHQLPVEPVQSQSSNGKSLTRSSINSPKVTHEHPESRADEFLDPHLKPKSTVEYISNGATIVNTKILNSAEDAVNVLMPMREYSYRYEVFVYERAYKVRCGMLIKTTKGTELGGMTTHPLPDSGIDVIEPGTKLEICFKFRTLMCPGNYFINAGISGYPASNPDSRIHLHRVLDADMFRINPYPNRKVSGLIDFSVSDEQCSSISIFKS